VHVAVRVHLAGGEKGLMKTNARQPDSEASSRLARATNLTGQLRNWANCVNYHLFARSWGPRVVASAGGWARQTVGHNSLNDPGGDKPPRYVRIPATNERLSNPPVGLSAPSSR
jgi:hypothetical protein